LVYKRAILVLSGLGDNGNMPAFDPEMHHNLGHHIMATLLE
jgi:hypothetical protein